MWPVVLSAFLIASGDHAAATLAHEVAYQQQYAMDAPVRVMRVANTGGLMVGVPILGATKLHAYHKEHPKKAIVVTVLLTVGLSAAARVEWAQRVPR